MLTIPEQSLFGLDISQSKLRLVQIRSKHRAKIITALREIDVPGGVIVDGEIADPKRLTQLVAAVYRGKELSDRIAGNGVISVLPESKTFIKLITLSGNDPTRLEAELKEEIPRHIPLPIEEIYYDWQIAGLTADGRSHIIIGAASRQLVMTYLTVLRNAGLLPFALEIEAAAITRCLLKEGEPAEPVAQIIIDMGAIRTGLIVARQGMIQFTVSLPISGGRITQTIAETLKIDAAEAEEAKIVCGLDAARCQGALKRVLFATLDDLSRKIETALAFYAENFEDQGPVGEIILTGGGANFLNIDRVLAERINLPVRLGNPLGNVKLPRHKVALSTLQSYTTAIGLALRGTQKDAVI